jgi:hypothetical protein
MRDLPRGIKMASLRALLDPGVHLRGNPSNGAIADLYRRREFLLLDVGKRAGA